ncbi:hypothetical protein HYV22_04135 [Candidatus Gottesmanbacteria bacterium]|nr:hypothetical protein [Candidatus Gottesmanbacteria bacterium]
METIQNETNNEDGALREIVQRYDDDPRIYIEQNLSIKTKDQQLILLKFNRAQQTIYQKIREIRSKGKPIRLIVLKARQEGVSTLCESLIFERTARYENAHSLIVAHEPESTDAIFQMSKLFYEMLPANKKPLRRYDNKKQMVFENPDEKTRGAEPGLRSKIVIATASKVRVGRGLTLHCFHGSEVAFWENATELMNAAMQAIPDNPNTMVFLESTANGLGGDGEYFYNLVQDALAKKTDFELIFLPWYLMPEYSLSFDFNEEKTRFETTLTDYEKSIQRRYDLTLEQLNWRRSAVKNKCGGDTDKFKQEYPITIEEAFIASSRSVIPKESVEAQRKYIREPVQELDGVLYYAYIKSDHYYSLGADPAEGVGQDDSAFTVMDRMTGREVAHFASNQIPPDLFAKKIMKIAEYFNNAIVVLEVNNHGLAVLNELIRLGYMMIFRERYFDKAANDWKRRLGWKTTAVTKPLMVDEFVKALREEDIGMSSATTVGQMLTFVHTDDAGKHSMGAESGQKDDCLISAMLALQGFRDLPTEFMDL